MSKKTKVAAATNDQTEERDVEADLAEQRAGDTPTQQRLQVVQKTVVTCPRCNGAEVSLQSTQGVVRYYRCKRCVIQKGPRLFRVLVDRHLTATMGDGEWDGQDVMVFGGGPSAGRFDMRCVRGRPTIACNDAWRWFKRAGLVPSISFSGDQLWLKRAHQDRQYMGATGIRVAGDNGIKIPESFLTVPMRDEAGFWGRSLGDGLRFGMNTGMAAVNLADILGAKKIYLVGFDLNGKDWSGAYTPERRSQHDLFLVAFREIAALVRARVEVVGHESPLTFFERARVI